MILPIDQKDGASLNDVIQTELRAIIPATPGFPLTDTGNAERLARQSGAILRYLHEDRAWLVYKGGVWVSDPPTVYRLATQAARSIANEAARETDPEKRRAMLKHALKSENRGGLNAALAVAQNLPRLTVAVSELNSDPMLFNLRNGTVNLRTGELLAHSPAHLITKQSPVVYDYKADCPLWIQFLERVFCSDNDLIRLVQQLIGICLTQDVSLQRMIVFFGRGANGKSTLLNVVLTLLGSYGKQAEPNLLFNRGGSAHPTGTADLFGASLAVCSESNDARSFDEAVVKRLTGGDPVKARFMGKDFFSFCPTHKLILATNYLPTVTGTDEGIWRRMLPIPFNVVIPESERDPHLQHKLVAELSGILNWAIDGCLDWQRHGLLIPKSVLEAIQDYRQEMDVLGQFLDEDCVIGSEYKVGATVLYEGFKKRLTHRGEIVWTQKRFGQQLRDRGFQTDRSDGGGRIVYRGLSLRDCV